MSAPTKQQMERVLRRYGRRILEGDAREARGEPRATTRSVRRYCAALKQVWDLAKVVAQSKPRSKKVTR